jgi:serine phosphatase RsbU (regulator of sigma subunit)/CHASE3 domain sensor protein
MNGNRRTQLATATFAVLVIALLVAGGLYVRSLIVTTFAVSSKLADARALDYDALRFMLDEETGLRGYAATGTKDFLAPYLRAKPLLEPSLHELAAALPGLGIESAAAAANDMIVTSRLYVDEVAGPLERGHLSRARELAIEQLGKRRVDRFRQDVRIINTIVANRTAVVDADVRSSIDRIGLLVGAAVVVVLLLSFLYTTQQSALAARVEKERTHAAEERREADILRSAYLTEKRIADTLQEAFVQRPLPSHPTFRFSATYVPASEEAKVGGDWYDALELPGNRVLFAIGDVTGHGIEAAVTMNRVRQALISAALFDPMPAGLLERVASELYRDKAPLVTAVAGFADSNTYEFVYATAGHPPPLLIEPGRPPRMLDCGSLPLGAMQDNEYRTFRIQSVPGAMLVLYTDGAIEHSRDVIAGEEILLAAAAEAADQSTMDPATYIHNTVFNGRDIGDDVAILTVGFAADPAIGVRISADRDGNSAFSARIAGSTIDPLFPAGRTKQAWFSRHIGKKVA